MAEHVVRSSAELQRACSLAQAGTEILVCGGLYDTPSVLKDRRGQPGRPIVFRAADDQWVSGGQAPDPYWGGGLPAQDAPRKPDVTDFAFLLIDKCHHVVIDGLRIGKCWPSILSVKDSSHLQIRNCVLRNGTYAIFAKGEKTSHLLIEDNEWQQDNSPDHDLWFKIDWKRAHGNEKSDGMYRYFNGGFLSTKGIRGKVVVRRNRILDAYNGIRMKVDNPNPHQSPPMNADVYIFDNDFIRIRDNPIEPEVFAYNWHVRHNRLVDCHSWFSFDGVTGGYWYLYGNIGYFLSRQGSADSSAHTMGRVLKLSYQTYPRTVNSERVPVFPWFVFNNSWHLRCPLIGGRNDLSQADGSEGLDFTAHLHFFNNAFEWCDAGRHGPWVCEPIDMIHNFDFSRSVDINFDYNICDRPDYFSYLSALGRAEKHGKLASGPIFDRLANGAFPLAGDSGASRSGWAGCVEVPWGNPAGLRAHDEDGTLNRGAVQGYGLTQAPDLEAQAAALLAEIAPSGLAK